MPKLNVSQIQLRVRELLRSSPEGMRWSEIAKQIETESPDTSPNTIQGSIQTLFKNARDITKVRRGVYVLTDQANLPDEYVIPSADIVLGDVQSGDASQVVRESDFYESFAEWLKEIEEVTEAAIIGGNALGGKWGTPDVIGVLKPKKADLIKFDLQIVSAEIKTDPSQPVTAFGQAVAYRLFSHRSYIVVPNTTGTDNFDRLEALCAIYGIGLVSFQVDISKPMYNLHIRAQTTQPDMFYVNQMAKRLHEYSADIFERIF